VTVAPPTGAPVASTTATWSGAPYWAPTVVDCPDPPAGLIVALTPLAVLTSEKTTEP